VYSLRAKGHGRATGVRGANGPKIKAVELHPFDGDHFEVYRDTLRAAIVSEQLGFLKRVLV